MHQKITRWRGKRTEKYNFCKPYAALEKIDVLGLPVADRFNGQITFDRKYMTGFSVGYNCV